MTVGGRWPFRGPGALDVTVDAFPIADVMVLALRDPYEASGELNGTLSLVGTARSPIVDMGVSLRDGAYRDFRAPYTGSTTDEAIELTTRGAPDRHPWRHLRCSLSLLLTFSSFAI